LLGPDRQVDQRREAFQAAVHAGPRGLLAAAERFGHFSVRTALDNPQRQRLALLLGQDRERLPDGSPHLLEIVVSSIRS
jgi:hypothetical protein